MKKMTDKSKPAVSRVDAIEAAAFLSARAGISISPRTVANWARLGRCPCLRVGGRVAFNLAELAAWLDAGRGGPELPTIYASSNTALDL